MYKTVFRIAYAIGRAVKAIRLGYRHGYDFERPDPAQLRRVVRGQ